MNVYISASSLYKAHGLAEILKKKVRGVTIVSKWHDPTTNESPESKLTDEEYVDRVLRNIKQIDQAQVVVLMDDFDQVPGGKHFELGYAFGKRIKCVTLGRREHAYTRHPDISNTKNLQELIGTLKLMVKESSGIRVAPAKAGR
jgi:nucleoside 2-deoxyribosyltransferase